MGFEGGQREQRGVTPFTPEENEKMRAFLRENSESIHSPESGRYGATAVILLMTKERSRDSLINELSEGVAEGDLEETRQEIGDSIDYLINKGVIVEEKDNLRIGADL